MNQPIRLSTGKIILYGTALLCSGFVALLYLSETIITMVEPLSKPALIKSMRLNEIDAYPAITPQIILMRNHLQPLRTVDGSYILPLGGIANKTTVFCRELEDMIIYTSDRYGFRNENELWDNKIDIVAVGDSFVQGACMDDEHHLVSQLRKRWPNTLNLGSFGNGPLANLATISEYALTQKPKYVLWFYVANDLAIDLPLEERSTILTSYLQEPNFSQNLQTAQTQIDVALSTFLIEEIERLEDEAVLTFTMSDFLALKQLQNKLRRLNEYIYAPPAPDFPEAFDYDRQEHIDYDRHSHIVAEAARRASSVGSKLIFVLVPDARMYRSVKETRSKPEIHVERVIASIARFGIPTIDLYKEFQSEENPMKYFAGLGGYYGHFNRAGYQKAGEALATQISKIEDDQRSRNKSLSETRK